jgi:hypothetical protein
VIDAGENVSSRQAQLVHSRPDPASHFGRHHQLVARARERSERLPQQLFGFAFRIDIRRIDEVYPVVERSTHQRFDVLKPEPTDHLPETLTAECHRAEAELGHEQPCLAQ